MGLSFSGGLILSGGLTVSGGDGGGGGGAVTGLARSLIFNFPYAYTAPTLGEAANWTHDEYSYTVSGGVMSLSFTLQSSVPGSTINSPGNGGYYFTLPPGWAFDSSVVAAGLSFNSQSFVTPSNTILATVSMVDYQGNTHSRSLYRQSSFFGREDLMAIFYPVWNASAGWAWGSVAETYSLYLTGPQNVSIQFTATIPVVAV